VTYIRRVFAIIAAAAVIVLVLLPVAAGAQEEVIPNNPNTVTVAGATATQNGTDPGAQVAGTSASRGSLAFTGSDIVGLVAISLGLIATGVVLLRSSRRRAAAAS
jgi:hypothetical protein